MSTTFTAQELSLDELLDALFDERRGRLEARGEVPRDLHHKSYIQWYDIMSNIQQ